MLQTRCINGNKKHIWKIETALLQSRENIQIVVEETAWPHTRENIQIVVEENSKGLRREKKREETKWRFPTGL